MAGRLLVIFINVAIFCKVLCFLVFPFLMQIQFVFITESFPMLRTDPIQSIELLELILYSIQNLLVIGRNGDGLNGLVTIRT